MLTKTRGLKRKMLAISITNGVIALLESNGTVGYYRQRGIGGLSKLEIQQAIYAGILDPSVVQLRELPENYSIYFEDPSIMGVAKANFIMH